MGSGQQLTREPGSDMNSADLKVLFAFEHHTMFEVMQRINETAQGISLVVDSEGRLVDTVTDGDLRRAVLAETDLSGQSANCDRNRIIPSPCRFLLREANWLGCCAGLNCVTSLWWTILDGWSIWSSWRI